MARMRYFIRGKNPDLAETGAAVLFRLEDGAPWALGEAIGPDGEWFSDDELARYYLLDSSININEIDAERARKILLAWHENGRQRVLPSFLPGDDGEQNPARTPEESAEREKLRARAQSVQDRINQRWAQVPTPEGAESVGRPSTND